MSTKIAENYDFTLYNSDEQTLQHKEIASYWEQPAMCRHFVDWEWYFSRPVEKYNKWLQDFQKEEMDMRINVMTSYNMGFPVSLSFRPNSFVKGAVRLMNFGNPWVRYATLFKTGGDLCGI